MNYEIIFSTFINKTQASTPRLELEQDLVAIAKVNDVQGFSLRDQLGYWAGELEQSHVLELLDINKATAFAVANQIKSRYSQDAVIVRPVATTVYFV